MLLGVGEALLPVGLFCYVLFQWLPASVAIAVVLGIVGATVYYLRYEKRHWKRLGVPGPEPNFLFGNSLEWRKGVAVMDTEWCQKYGRVVGNHLLGYPDLLISDLDLVREVMVKEFPHFMDRMDPAFAEKDNDFSLFENALTVKMGEDWKLIRNHITPAFTTGKIKNMVPIFNNCSKTLCDVLREYADRKEELPVKEKMSRFTLDVISRAAFGFDGDMQRNEDDRLLKNAQSMVELKRFEPAFLSYFLFPNLSKKYEKWTKSHLFRNSSHIFFKDLLRDLLEKRQSNEESQKTVDFFQLLLNSMDEEDRMQEDEDHDIVHEAVKKVTNKRGLKQIEVLAQSFVFLIAGYETTASTIQFALYMLACFPEIQEKVRDEVNSIVDPESEDITYEDISRMHYIEQVICETLRLYSPATRTNRMCTETTYLRDIRVDKGCTVSIPIWVIHHDEELYPNPLEFDPERFSPAEKARRDPLSFLPFGYGPRNCIGMRFAQFELRMILAHVIKRFEISLPEGAPMHPLEVDTKSLTRPVKELKLLLTNIE
ncbi:hypothetical protein QR680_017958 [Steinernema hermaphroditum]|uniref:Cytochrome P450 n=1 Tax=Steinernema hermaphroditum TaxID=289476 RepID=A0AA39HGF0_9BILA|nr:hypothetical protein QR680_017958 [Steinernema hermaphroditum]